MPASSEFVRLCRSQIAITASLGASLSVVYLTEKFVKDRDEKPKLIPIVTYPESGGEWEPGQLIKALPANLDPFNHTPPLLRLPSSVATPISSVQTTPEVPYNDPPPSENGPHWQPQQQIVLPLIHQGVVMGFLVTGREDRPWSPLEQTQLQDIVQTLSMARILDQRSQWLKEQFTLQQQLQSQQYETFHTLLHQFKNPLTALRTFGKLLMKRLLPEDKNWGVANSIVRESDRLRELLDHFSQTVELGENHLNFSPNSADLIMPTVEIIETADPEPQSSITLPLLPGTSLLVEPVSVETVLTPLLLSTQAIAEERQLRLEIEPWGNLPQVNAHPQALREVLSNLLDNALKYTPPGHTICVSIRVIEDKKLGIGISDTGKGIPQKDLAHLFERHYRGVQAQSDIPGTGLGLAIARDLMQQMHGEIEVFSPLNPEWVPGDIADLNLDHGTTFIVWLACIISSSPI